MIAAVLEHFTCYLQTGSAKAARRAVLLLERLALDPDVDERVRELAETMEASLALMRRRTAT
ncbi:MAG: hypothetical protein A3G81_23905 [Betaproteobacteria bacterium RIFCSPLOWO2_12_FULL_65_14]|nr:MAG: hypothetical protein A3G81_23905 [Betaproteobacteria bacterium RIFCSPLOWO2_12_FULL_65_14]